MPTKEEILINNSTYLDTAIYISMEEYAKQEAIEFINWIELNKWFSAGEKMWKCRFFISEPRSLTISELFNEYKNM